MRDDAQSAVTYAKVHSKLPKQARARKTAASWPPSAHLRRGTVEYSPRAALNAGCAAAEAQPAPESRCESAALPADQRVDANERDALVDPEALAQQKGQAEGSVPAEPADHLVQLRPTAAQPAWAAALAHSNAASSASFRLDEHASAPAREVPSAGGVEPCRGTDQNRACCRWPARGAQDQKEQRRLSVVTARC